MPALHDNDITVTYC